MIEQKRKKYLADISTHQKVILDEASISLLERFNKMRTDRRRRVMSCGLRGRLKRKAR
jgi:hypothetical protein